MELAEKETRLLLIFKDDKLVRLDYRVIIPVGGNPFQYDGDLRDGLIEKYGTEAMKKYPAMIKGMEQTIYTKGLRQEKGKTGDFDPRVWHLNEDCIRCSEWVLPRMMIWCGATSIRSENGGPDSRQCSIVYTSDEWFKVNRFVEQKVLKKREQNRAASLRDDF